MAAVFLHDKQTIERRLRRNVFLHLYSISDLDDFFWPYTTWFAPAEDRDTDPIALLYIGQALPTLIALDDSPQEMRELLKSILHLLPRRFSAHLTPGVESAFGDDFSLQGHGEHLKMALIDPAAATSADGRGVCSLGSQDRNEVDAFYARCYPGNWFDPRMLETGQYYGIRDGGELVSVSGIHVYSPQFRVAALGNIATAPSHRNQGFARRVIAGTCRSLIADVQHIGLNVRADNQAAIACYRRLGFEPAAHYNEFTVARV